MLVKTIMIYILLCVVLCIIKVYYHTLLATNSSFVVT